jgi:hypothetical protein
MVVFSSLVSIRVDFVKFDCVSHRLNRAQGNGEEDLVIFLDFLGNLNLGFNVVVQSPAGLAEIRDVGHRLDVIIGAKQEMVADHASVATRIWRVLRQGQPAAGDQSWTLGVHRNERGPASRSGSGNRIQRRQVLSDEVRRGCRRSGRSWEGTNTEKSRFPTNHTWFHAGMGRTGGFGANPP